MVVILFGATGSAGGSVLSTCLRTARVSEVRVVSRRPIEVAHDKLRVLVHSDFLDFDAIGEAFRGVDACFYCLGVSVTQVPDEATYRTITHDFALAAARAVHAASPDAVFHFISGQGTRADSRFMWARVKAETEAELMDLVDAVCWRPAFIDGEDSRSAPRLYQAMRPLVRLLRPFKSVYVKGDDIGRAMLQATLEQLPGRVIENAEIRAIASRWDEGSQTGAGHSRSGGSGR
jgi:uncharacterized protein YbjT (DUF2867 family)